MKQGSFRNLPSMVRPESLLWLSKNKQIKGSKAENQHRKKQDLLKYFYVPNKGDAY